MINTNTISNTIKVVTPHAAVKVWNYRDRISAEGASTSINIDAINQVIISTVSLMSISTTKSKSNPEGTFEIVLAPTKNWVQVLTPGSWLVIMMSNDPITQNDFTTADADKVKMFGRISGVRAKVGVDENGAHRTTYSVVGSDWGQIFNTNLYVDPIARDGNDTTISGTGRFAYGNYLTDLIKKSPLPDSTYNVKNIMNIWGKTNTSTKQVNESFRGSTIIAKAEAAFSVPQEVANFFNFKTSSGHANTKLIDIISLISGPLKADDSYDSSIIDSVGIIRPDSIFGTNSLWQLLMDNCNSILNEMIVDMRWENGTAKLALYKRIKPFIVRPDKDVYLDTTKQGAAANHSILKPLISRYINVRKVNIPIENVIGIDAGTNWVDKYNYAEIQIDHSLQDDALAAAVKLNSAIYDTSVFSREGFKPMIAQCKYITPKSDGGYDYLNIYNWKFLLKEWYFDTHNMLNGTVMFTGVNDYIQVGDNITIKATILGPDNNLNTDNINNPNISYLMGHVESISHSFLLEPNTSTRSFITTVNFVRGIIVLGSNNGKNISYTVKTGFIDQDASALTFNQENNNLNILSLPADATPTESSGGKNGSR